MQIFPIFILLFTGINWGLSFSIAKIVTNFQAHPFGITFWQSFVACIILFFFILYDARKNLFINFKLIFLYLQLSLIGLTIPSILFFYGAEHLPAGILSITVTLVPILTYVIGYLIGQEIFSFNRLIGVILGITSILIIVLPEQNLPEPHQVFWVFVTCICSLCYACQAVLISAKFSQKDSPIAMAFWMNFFSSIILLPIVIKFDYFIPLKLPFSLLEYSLFSLGIIEAICFSLLMYLIVSSGPLFASQVGYLVTLSGIIWGIIIFDEVLSIWIWIAVLLLFFGIYLVKPKET
tara:strand:- start:79 stop:957 length:879 start_codon:yes stop_codon:yes gene_type:complete